LNKSLDLKTINKSPTIINITNVYLPIPNVAKTGWTNKAAAAATVVPRITTSKEFLISKFLENIKSEPGTINAKNTNKIEINRFLSPMSVTRKTQKMGTNTAILNSPTESSLLVKITPTTLHLPQDLLQLIS
jgi:hypothetical protein